MTLSVEQHASRSNFKWLMMVSLIGWIRIGKTAVLPSDYMDIFVCC